MKIVKTAVVTGTVAALAMGTAGVAGAATPDSKTTNTKVLENVIVSGNLGDIAKSLDGLTDSGKIADKLSEAVNEYLKSPSNKKADTAMDALFAAIPDKGQRSLAEKAYKSALSGLNSVQKDLVQARNAVDLSVLSGSDPFSEMNDYSKLLVDTTEDAAKGDKKAQEALNNYGDVQSATASGVLDESNTEATASATEKRDDIRSDISSARDDVKKAEDDGASKKDIAELNDRLDELDARLDKVESRLEGLEEGPGTAQISDTTETKPDSQISTKPAEATSAASTPTDEAPAQASSSESSPSSEPSTSSATEGEPAQTSSESPVTVQEPSGDSTEPEASSGTSSGASESTASTVTAPEDTTSSSSSEPAASAVSDDDPAKQEALRAYNNKADTYVSANAQTSRIVDEWATDLAYKAVEDGESPYDENGEAKHVYPNYDSGRSPYNELQENTKESYEREVAARQEVESAADDLRAAGYTDEEINSITQDTVDRLAIHENVSGQNETSKFMGNDVGDVSNSDSSQRFNSELQRQYDEKQYADSGQKARDDAERDAYRESLARNNK